MDYSSSPTDVRIIVESASDMEIVSKADVYEAYKGYKAFLKLK